MPKFLIGVDDGGSYTKDGLFSITGAGLAISQEWTNRVFLSVGRRDHDPETLFACGGAQRHPHLQQGREHVPTTCRGTKLTRWDHPLRAERSTQSSKEGPRCQMVVARNASRMTALGALLHRPMPGRRGPDKCFALGNRQPGHTGAFLHDAARWFRGRLYE